MKLLIVVLLFNTFHNIIAINSPAACPSVTIKNGRVRKKNVYVQYSCNKRFILFGNRFATCQNGEWSAPPPVCVRNRCTAIREIANGDLVPFNKGATVQFWCKAGYTLKGSSVIYCDGARWNDTAPFCIANGTRPALSCDFETVDLCGWIQDVNHDFDWTRYNRNMTTWHVKDGPAYDHTKGPNGTGHYMFVDASRSTEAEKARLISPIYDRVSTNVCLKFYYHMPHHGNGILNVRLKYTGTNWSELNNDTLVFSQTGYHGSEWMEARVNLTILQDEYQIIFEAVRGDAAECEIAFDDVSIVENCTFVDEADDQTSTTEYYEYETTEEEVVHTCKDHCFTAYSTITQCSCEVDCLLYSACCPDFYYYCLKLENFNSTTEYDAETTTEYVETTPMESATTIFSKSTSAATTKSTRKIPLTATMSRLPTTASSRAFPVTIALPNSGRRTEPIGRLTPPLPPVKYKYTIVEEQSKTSSKTGIDYVTRKVAQTSTTVFKRTTTAPKEITSKVRVINFGADGVTTRFSPHNESRTITKVLESKPKPVDSSRAPFLMVALIVIGVAVVLSLIVVAYYKFNVKHFLAGKRMVRARKNGHSVTELRYLTSDEALDFRLALLEDDDN